MKNHSQSNTPNKTTFFLLFFTLLSTQLPSAHPKTHPSDIKSLSLFIKSIHPSSIRPGSCLSTWSFTLDPCDNLFSSHFTCGLRCDIIDTHTNLSRITEITLDSANYTGNLYLTNLPHLQTLQIPDNSLAGPIPSSLSTLHSLNRLILSGNSFSHHIPPSLSNLPSLAHLSLDNNRLTGPIPSTFNSLTSLTHLNLQHNRLTHSIPNISSLRNLTSLDISDNHFSFSSSSLLPDSLISFSARNNTLPSHHLHHQILTAITDQLQNLPYLQVLDLSYNHFSGSIPSLIFQHQSLQQLSLSHNRLSSLSPPHLHRNSRLIAVDLSYNRITGTLPDFFTEMPDLSALSLEYNRFSGKIPSHYAKRVETAAAEGGGGGGGGGASSFRRLLLGGNYLFGPIPGPLLLIKPGSVNVSLMDNCLLFCPENFFFCKGGVQKPLTVCQKFIH